MVWFSLQPKDVVAINKLNQIKRINKEKPVTTSILRLAGVNQPLPNKHDCIPTIHVAILKLRLVVANPLKPLISWIWRWVSNCDWIQGNPVTIFFIQQTPNHISKKIYIDLLWLDVSLLLKISRELWGYRHWSNCLWPSKVWFFFSTFPPITRFAHIQGAWITTLAPS